MGATYDTVPPRFTSPYQAFLDPETGVMLRLYLILVSRAYLY
jgi:hypothetical protein